MDDYLKIPLLASLKRGHFPFFSNEMQDITLIEQLAIYQTFEHEQKIGKRVIGILPVSEIVGKTLSAEKIMKVLVEYFEQTEVSTSDSCFLCMDTTNANLGEEKKA